MDAKNLSARGIRLTVGVDDLDLTNFVDQIVLNYDAWNQDGLIKTSATISFIYGLVPVPPEPFDSRDNFARWHRGQTVKLQYTDDSGVLQPHLMCNPLYILTEPDPPDIQANPNTFTIRCGCALFLFDFPVPDGDRSGIVAGNNIGVSAAIGNILEAGGITNHSINIPGNVSAPLIKNDSGSFIAQAGAIAFAYGYYLYQDGSGAIVSRQFNVDGATAAVFSRVVGINEPLFQAIAGNAETTVEHVKTKSILLTATAPPAGSESPYYDQTITEPGLVRQVLPDSQQGYLPTTIKRTRIRKFAITSEGNIEVDITEVEYPRGQIDKEDATPLALVLAQITTTQRKYDFSDRLIKKTETIQELKGIVDQVADNLFEMITTIIRTTTYLFGDTDAETTVQTDEISHQIDSTQQVKIITNPAETDTLQKYELHEAIQLTKSWDRVPSTEYYSLIESPLESRILVNPDETQQPYELTIAPGGRIVSDPDPNNAPPQAIYRAPDSNLEEEVIEGEAFFDLSSGHERERTYEIDYLPNVAAANARALELGKYLVGARLSYEFESALTDDVMGGLAPLIRADYTKDDVIRQFICEAIALTYTRTRQHFYAIGAWLSKSPVGDPTNYTPPYKVQTRLKGIGTGGIGFAANIATPVRLAGVGTGGIGFEYVEPTDIELSGTGTGGVGFVASL